MYLLYRRQQLYLHVYNDDINTTTTITTTTTTTTAAAAATTTTTTTTTNNNNNNNNDNNNSDDDTYFCFHHLSLNFLFLQVLPYALPSMYLAASRLFAETIEVSRYKATTCLHSFSDMMQLWSWNEFIEGQGYFEAKYCFSCFTILC